MVEFTQTPGAGIADLQRAALAEARRMMREAKGDRRVARKLVFERLRELGWISEKERTLLDKMYEVGDGSGKHDGKHDGEPDGARTDATADFLKARRLYDQLLVSGNAGPVALVLAAGAAGSFEAVEGDDGTAMVLAKSNRNYQGVLGGAGAVIGGAIGGAPGAAIGGAIGGVIGTIVDDCKD